MIARKVSLVLIKEEIDEWLHDQISDNAKRHILEVVLICDQKDRSA